MIECYSCLELEKKREPASIAWDDKYFCVKHGRESLYEKTINTQSDINEHLPLLRELASRCKHVTEFGMRWARGSTVAFLAAQPETFISWDLDPTFVTSPRVYSLLPLVEKTKFQPRTGNTLEIIIEPTELLFIDTLHTGKHLLAELERHGDPKDRKVSKYLVFHDTALFGLVGEDGIAPGLRTAIRQFQKYYSFPLWKLMQADKEIEKATGIADGTLLDLENNSGLIVLEHVCANGHSPRRVGGRCDWCGQLLNQEKQK